MKRTTIAAMAAAALLVAGCGDDESKDKASAPGSQLATPVSADSGSTAPGPVDLSQAPPDEGDEGQVGVAGRASCATVSSDNLTELSAVQRSTLCLLNAERSARRLRPFRSNSMLAAAALRHSRDMVSRTYFSHDTLGGVGFDKRVVRVGYLRGARGWSIGENIAWGSGTRATPHEIVNSWMNSPGHRANILSRKFAEIGLGVAVGVPEDGGGPEGLTYTTDFGVRK